MAENPASIEFNAANSLFVDEKFEEALKKYNTAIELDSQNPEYFLKRFACHMKTKNFTDALGDANAAIELAPNDSTAYFKKGTALFHLDEFETAHKAFLKAQQLDPSNPTFKTWIRKCEAEIQTENPSAFENHSSLSATATATTTTSASSSSSAASSSFPSSSSSSTPSSSSSSTSSTTESLAKRIRHEHYQTNTHVIISVFAKNVKQENASVEISEKNVAVSIKLSDASSYQLDLDLFAPIVSSESRFQILSTKLEIKLKKLQPGLHWTSLEETGVPVLPQPSQTSSNNVEVKETPPTYPSSSRVKRDWDKIAKEAAEEKLGDEEGLNKLFQDIYTGGSDDQRRAMIKSFVESNGTVLSTNWEDVGVRHVDGTPPKGMEMHNWKDV